MGKYEAKPKKRIGLVTMASATGSGVSMAFAGLAAWLLAENDVHMPPEVVAYLAVIVGFIGATIGGWVAPPADGE